MLQPGQCVIVWGRAFSLDRREHDVYRMEHDVDRREHDVYRMEQWAVVVVWGRVSSFACRSGVAHVDANMDFVSEWTTSWSKSIG